MAYVYRHIRLDKNEPFYIGIGSDSNGKYTRANSVSDRNSIWKKIVSKAEYRVDILLDDLTWEEACEKEKEFIVIYGRINIETGILANMTDGGDGVLNLLVSDQTKVKISNSNKGKLSGNKNPFYGKRHTDEFKQMLSNLRKEKYSGVNHPLYGKPCSDSRRYKISESNKGKNKGGSHCRARLVINMENGIYYDCILDAANSVGLPYSRMKDYLIGHRKNKTNLVYA